MATTKLITYSLRDRGRQFRGADRDLNIRKVVDSIRSNEMQERVKHRDLVGFYGHWARVKFGLNPKEGNAQFKIEPAIVTTALNCTDDGIVSHQAEFLKTDSGQIAEKMYNSRVGGFSSAIDSKNFAFHGFDYVQEPNYSTNRGYDLVLDDVSGTFSIQDMTLDDIAIADYNDQITALLQLIDKSDLHNKLLLDSLSHLQAENEELLSRLATKPVLERVDSTPPTFIDNERASQILDDIATFRDAKNLPEFGDQKQRLDSATKSIFDRFKR